MWLTSLMMQHTRTWGARWGEKWKRKHLFNTHHISIQNACPRQANCISLIREILSISNLRACIQKASPQSLPTTTTTLSCFEIWTIIEVKFFTNLCFQPVVDNVMYLLLWLLQDRTGRVLKCAGTSVLLVWASTVGGFSAAALIPVPALRAFALQAALLHTFAVAAMLLLFPAAVSVDLRRRRPRLSCCCCSAPCFPDG